MQEENRNAQRKTCRIKFGLETKWAYSAGTGSRTWAQWSTARRKYHYVIRYVLPLTLHVYNHDYGISKYVTYSGKIKSPQKFWNILKAIYFGSYLEISVLYCIPLQSVVFLLYNPTLIITIARCRAEILSLLGGWVRKVMCLIWLTRPFHCGIDWHYHLGYPIDFAE